MKILIALLAVLTGGGQAPQSAMNARMRDAVGSPFLAGLVSYVVSAVVLVGFAASGWLGKSRVPGILRAPWWVWFAGFIGAAQVTVNAIAVRRISASVLTVATIFGELAVALVLDHFGALGLERVRVNAWRIAGVVLVGVGTLLMQKR